MSVSKKKTRKRNMAETAASGFDVQLESNKSLSGNEIDYQSILENSSDIIVIINDTGNIIYATPSAYDTLGYKLEDLIGANSFEMVHPEDVPIVTKEFAKLLNNPGSVSSTEGRARLKDGTWHTFEITGKNLLNDPSIKGIIVNFHDISERKLAEEALRRSEERYRLLADHVADVISIMDMNLEYVYLSPSIEQLRGYTAEEAMQQRPEDTMTPASYEQIVAVFMEQFAIEQTDDKDLNRTWSMQIESPCKDGSMVWVEMTMSFLRDENGVATGILSSSRNITKRKMAEQRMQQSEEKFHLLFQLSPEAIILSDPQGNLLNVNERLIDLIGYEENDFVGPNILDFEYLTEESKVKALDNFTRRMNGEVIEPYELTFIRKNDGEERVGLINAQTIYGKNGAILYNLIMISDITERKRAEQAVIESKEKYQAILENIEDSFYEVDIAGNFTFFNDSLTQLFGYSADELIGMNNREYADEENTKILYRMFNQVYRTGESAKGIGWQVTRGDGSRRFVETSATLIKGPDNKPMGFRGVARDITERKQAEEAQERRTQEILALQKITTSIQSALELKEVLQLISEAVVLYMGFHNTMIFLADETGSIHRGTVFYPNDDESILLALKRNNVDYRTPPTISDIENALGLPLTQIDIPIVRGFSKVVDNCLDGKETVVHNLYEIAEQLISREECENAQKLLQAKTIVDVPFYAKEKLVGSILAYTNKEEINEVDLEPLRLLADHAAIAIENARLNENLERRVIERTTQLQTANKELENFAYSVAHDLRTPLRGIDGFSQVLYEDYEELLDDEGKGYLQRVRSASQKMSRLIDDILHLLHLTSSEMNIGTVNLSTLARSIVDGLSEQQADRQVEFIIAPELVIQGDQQLLMEALNALLGNAWKFTSKHENARIEFGCTKENEQTTYFVRDNGAGFDMNYVNKIFTAFQRLHLADEFEGAGIGLAKVQRIIHRHGGEIWAESAVEQGATFYFTLWSEEDQQDSL